MTIVDVHVDPAPRASAASWFLGPHGTRWLLSAHILSALGGGWVTVALADSLFFGVDLHDSRAKVLGYLAASLLPVTILAPFAGRIVDRRPNSAVAHTLSTTVLRSVAAAALALHLGGPWFVAWAVVVLVAARTFTACRYSLVRRMFVPDQIIAANVRFTKWGTVTGAFAVSTGVAITHQFGGRTLLLAAAMTYAASACCRPAAPVDVADDGEDRSAALAPDRVETVQRGRCVGPAVSFGALRWSVGLLGFAGAFAMRGDGSVRLAAALVGAAYAIGGMLGTITAPRLRRRMSEEQMMGCALVPAVTFAFAAALVPTPLTMGFAGLTVGYAAALSRQAFDAIVQSSGDRGAQGRRYASFEALAQVTWVSGAGVATVFGPPLVTVWPAVAVALALSSAAVLRSVVRVSAPPGYLRTLTTRKAQAL